MYLLLPGFSIKNKAEAEAIASALRDLGKDVYIHNWRHWSSETQWDPIEEIKIIKQNINIEERINIIAKSIGTFIACSILPELRIEKLVLMGIPINDLSEQELEVYKNLKDIKGFSVIANNNDSHGNVVQVTTLLESYDCRLIVKESEDHSYPYIDDILSLLDLK